MSLEIAGKVCWIKNNPYLCIEIFGRSENSKTGTCPLKRCLFSFLEIQPRGGTETGSQTFFTHSFNKYFIMRTFCKAVNISIRVEIVRLVKVRAYKRIRNGKIERVRSHYRRY